MNWRQLNIWILGTVFILISWILFWGNPGIEITRSIHHLWNAGHILYFALLSYLLLQMRPIARQTISVQWIIILSVTLVGGILIEFSQIDTSRTPDREDILRDMLGSLLVLAFNSVKHRSRVVDTLRLSLVIMLLVFLKPFVVSLLDEGIARVQFPVLADFSTPFEMERWLGDADRSRRSPVALGNRQAMQVKLSTHRYSGVYLEYFPGDWRNHRLLRLTIYNPQSQLLRLTCRIHDARHAEGVQRYTDRYNQIFEIQPGLNNIEIDLATVANAPRDRSMDIGRIRGLGIFASALESPRIFYLKQVRLE